MSYINLLNMKIYQVNIDGTHDNRPDGIKCIKGSIRIEAVSALAAQKEVENKIWMNNKVGVVSVGQVTELI